MRIRLRRRTNDSCQLWLGTPLSSTAAGPDHPTIDRYAGRAIVRPGESSLETFARVSERLFHYDIFPPRLIQGTICPPGSIARGSTIVQRMLFGPFALEMAVRVDATWDRQTGALREAGFSYITLAGHAEQGVASFEVAHDERGRVTVTLAARSRPGLLLTRLGRPVARPLQQALTRMALRRLCD